jgi:metallo-beta-lactamase family protein
VVTIGGLSAHAGQDFLTEYVKATQASLKKLILVHGEPDAEEALRQKLFDLGLKDVDYPLQYDVMEF